MTEFDKLADLLADTPGDWAERAACKDEDPEIFFPISEVGPGARDTALAKAVCARCPVRKDCLSYALDRAIPEGVFGGKTGAERDRMARRPRRSKPLTSRPGRPRHEAAAQR
jgi:WhiB family transcriptional regulator, redox-sensing transcriptional regulator